MTINFILFAFNLLLAFVDSSKYLAILNAFIAGFTLTIFIYKAKELNERNQDFDEDLQ